MNQMHRPGSLNPEPLYPDTFRSVTAPQAAIAADRPVAALVPGPLTAGAMTLAELTWSGRLTVDDVWAGGR